VKRGVGTGRTALLGGALGLAFAAALVGPGALAGLVPARGDLADFFWPMKAYTAARWAAGSLPLWNPLSGCGEPWLAQLQTGVLYPGDLPFLLGGAAGPLAALALHLAIAAAGMAAWLSDLGTSRAGALAGSAVWAGGGAFLSLAPVYNNFCTAAYLPWLFLGARRAVRGASPAGFALAVALAFLGGRQDMTGHLGLDRGCALGFGKLCRGILEHSPHQRDEIGRKDSSAGVHVCTLPGNPCPGAS
jgi:hypothetical protein